MQDIESQDDPWMRMARHLCSKPAKPAQGQSSAFLFHPEELVACIEHGQAMAREKPQKKESKAPFLKAGTVSVSQIQEARRHDTLCSWLSDERGWMFDPWDAELISEAALKISKDEVAAEPAAQQRQRRDPPPEPVPGYAGTPGLCLRLRPVPVCQTCVQAYAILHSVLTMIHGQRRDIWAKREVLRMQEEEKQKRQSAETELLQTLALQTRTGTLTPRTSAERCAALCRATRSRTPKSLFLDDELAATLAARSRADWCPTAALC